MTSFRHAENHIDDRPSTVVAEISICDLVSYISYFWMKVRNLVAYETMDVSVYVSPPSLYENLLRTKVRER